jgi:hypothetical protein
MGTPEGATDAGAAGDGNAAACERDQDCAGEPDTCESGACVDGVCSITPLPQDTTCEGGACDGQGVCVPSTCDSGKRDGDETGLDCGGPCGLCPDGQGCAAAEDCLSGVCTGAVCQASACSDGVKNGKETGIDCGGGCPLKCTLGAGCALNNDCAVAAGDFADSVRCVAEKCVSTKPPTQGGPPRYWQDFRPERLMANAESCTATDKACLVGVLSLYQMGGIGPTGANKPITQSLFTNDGVIGSGGKLDGTLCLTRPGTDLSILNAGAITVMAWVKPTRTKAPWESAIIGGLGHYFIALDTNPTTQRFLAAVGTTQSNAFTYQSSTATGEVPSDAWHHVAATYSSAESKLTQYVDGAQVHVSALTGNLPAEPVAVFLGCRKDATWGQFFIGSLDEVVVYPRALAAAELSDYVARTKP